MNRSKTFPAAALAALLLQASPARAHVLTSEPPEGALMFWAFGTFDPTDRLANRKDTPDLVAEGLQVGPIRREAGIIAFTSTAFNPAWIENDHLNVRSAMHLNLQVELPFWIVVVEPARELTLTHVTFAGARNLVDTSYQLPTTLRIEVAPLLAEGPPAEYGPTTNWVDIATSPSYESVFYSVGAPNSEPEDEAHVTRNLDMPDLTLGPGTYRFRFRGFDSTPDNGIDTRLSMLMDNLAFFGSVGSAGPIPEPATALALGAAVVAVGGRRRRSATAP